MEQINQRLRCAARHEATVLAGVLSTLAPDEQAEYLISLLLGAGVNLGGRAVVAAVRTVATEKAADLIMEGRHVEALRLAATLGDKQLATQALAIGLAAHPEPDDEYNWRLRWIYDDEVGTLPGDLGKPIELANA